MGQLLVENQGNVQLLGTAVKGTECENMSSLAHSGKRSIIPSRTCQQGSFEERSPGVLLSRDCCRRSRQGQAYEKLFVHDGVQRLVGISISLQSPKASATDVLQGLRMLTVLGFTEISEHLGLRLDDCTVSGNTFTAKRRRSKTMGDDRSLNFRSVVVDCCALVEKSSCLSVSSGRTRKVFATLLSPLKKD